MQLLDVREISTCFFLIGSKGLFDVDKLQNSQQNQPAELKYPNFSLPHELTANKEKGLGQQHKH